MSDRFGAAWKGAGKRPDPKAPGKDAAKKERMAEDERKMGRKIPECVYLRIL